MKKSPLRRRGRERFPKLANPAFRAFVRQQGCVIRYATSSWRSPCRYYDERCADEACHVRPKARGVGDAQNLYCGCPGHHDEQEGHTQEFEERYGLDLQAIADELWERYQAETGG